MPAKPRCDCGCGQAPAATTRLRKASCSCGQSIMRVSRVALALISAECRECGFELVPDCRYDRIAAGDESAIAELEAQHDRRLDRAEIKSTGRRANMHRCGDCSAIRSADPGRPCAKCGSERAPDVSYMHPRAARAVGSMPF